jgi:5-methylcytosine-specific restriction endonuclease McrA
MPTKEYIREYRQDRKAKAIKYLGGKCKKCKSKENLEFDHIDPSTKSNQISSMFTTNLSDFYLELDKCQLLCRKCHLLKSTENGDYIRNRKSWSHGASGYINQKCRCEICINEYKIYRKNRWKKEHI